MTETTIETVEIPGGGRGVRLLSGEVLNPSLASIKSLVRAGEPDYRLVLDWLEAERSREADRLAKADAALEETRAQILADPEARAAQLEELKAAEPWRFA